MYTKIKFVITFLVVLITILIFYKHYLLNELTKSIIILLIGSIMTFGLWILPTTGKLKENNEKITNFSQKIISCVRISSRRCFTIIFLQRK